MNRHFRRAGDMLPKEERAFLLDRTLHHRDCERTKELLQECLHKRNNKEQSLSQCFKTFLDHEFNNPVPRFIRALIKVIHRKKN